MDYLRMLVQLVLITLILLEVTQLVKIVLDVQLVWLLMETVHHVLLDLVSIMVLVQVVLLRLSLWETLVLV